jgi:hypothetical protein
MDAQRDFGTFTALDRLGQRLLPGQARRVGRGGGDLTVLDGRIWLTGQGDCEDRVLEAGQRLRLEAAQAVVMESLDRGRTARVVWQPRRSVIHRLGLRDLVGAVFAVLARRAASSARRAHGCMPCGDSIASSGALK